MEGGKFSHITHTGVRAVRNADAGKPSEAVMQSIVDGLAKAVHDANIDAVGRVAHLVEMHNPRPGILGTRPVCSTYRVLHSIDLVLPRSSEWDETLGFSIIHFVGGTDDDIFVLVEYDGTEHLLGISPKVGLQVTTSLAIVSSILDTMAKVHS
jgi:hypothetical protein